MDSTHAKKPFADDPRNREFVQLMKASGWRQAKIADRLRISPGVVSQYLSGTTRPSDSTLEHFRTVLALDPEGAKTRAVYPEHQERIVTPDEPEVENATDQLRELHAKAPEKFQAAKVLIDTLYRSTPRGKRAVVNSKEVSPAGTVAKNVAAKVSAGSPKDSPKQKARERSGEK